MTCFRTTMSKYFRQRSDVPLFPLTYAFKIWFDIYTTWSLSKLARNYKVVWCDLRPQRYSPTITVAVFKGLFIYMEINLS